jgi:ArsR family transcriptional regulator, lead/cadmium/zinc/bismuth-responsive transcriptional repressor
MASPDQCDLLCLDLELAESVRHSLLGERACRAAAARAGALADPTRLRLAAALGQAGELCVCDLAWISGRSQTLVSHHLRALRDAGLAASRREGRIVFYRLTDIGKALLAAVVPEALEVARL